MRLSRRQMNREGNRRINRHVAAAAMAAMASAGLMSQADVVTNDAWGTAPVSVNFSGTNWTIGTTTPGTNTGNATSGDALYFGTSTTTSLTNDDTNFTFGGLNFNAGASTFTIGGDSFILSGNITNNSTSLQTISTPITLAGNESINSASGAITLSGNVTGGGTFGITLAGPSAVTLSGANTLSTTTLGTSVVGNNNNTALTGAVGTTLNLNSTQNIGAIVVGTGANVINVGANAAITSTTITQANSGDRFDALNINLGSGASMSTTVSNNAANLLTINSQYNVVTLNGTDFATNSSGNIAATSYVNSTATGVGSTNQNTNIVGNVSLSSSPTTNTLRFGATTGYTISITSNNSLFLNGPNGAILMSANSGNVNNTITGGTLSGSSNRGLAILNFDTTSGSSLVISSNYNNYPVSGSGSSGTVNLLIAGGGKVVLGGANFINGNLLVDGSTLSVASDFNLGAVNGNVSVASATNGSQTVTLAGNSTNTSGLAVGDVLLGQLISGISNNGTGTAVTLASSYTGTNITGNTAVGFVGGGSVNLNGGTLAVTGTFALGETNNTGNASTGLSTTVRNRNLGLGNKGGTIDVSNGNILTVPGVISGAGPFTMTDSGTLVLTGANIYTGATILNGGVTNLGIAQNGTTSGPLGAGASTQAINFTGGTLQYSASNNTDYSARIAAGASSGAVSIDTNGVNVSFGTGLTASESGGLTKLGDGTLTLSASNSYSGGTTIDAGTISQTAAGALGSGTITLGDGSSSASATLSGAVGSTATNANNIIIASGGSGTYTIVDTSGADYIFSGNISLNNAATFKTTGTGALFLSGPITGSSLITIDGGNSTTKFVDIYAVSSSTFTGNILVQNTGDMKFGNGANNAFGTATTLTLDATSSLDCSGLIETFAGLNDAVAGAGLSKVFDNGANLTLGGSGPYSFSGNLSGGGSLTKSGVGTQALTGANGFSGGTAVQNGTLVLGTGGSLAGSNTLTLGSGGNSGIFQLGDASGAVNTTVTSLTTSGNGTTNAVVGGNGAVSTLTINISTTDSYGGLLGGSGTNQNNLALAKTGNGTLTLAASNSYSGGTTIKAGTISQTAAGALGSGTITLGDGSTSASATLSGAVGSSIINANPITIASGGNGTYTVVDTSGSDYSFSGNISLNNAATFKTTGGGAMFLSGPITGSSLITIDGGNSTTKFVSLNVSSASTFTGNILVQNKGQLKFGNSASNALSTATTLTLDATSSMDTGLLSQTFAGLNDVVAGAGGSTIINAGGGTTLTLGGNGSYSFSGNISGAGGLTKSGVEAQVLAGLSSYTGGTIISAGTLFANNASNSIGNGTVALNGGTLAGNGTINNGSNLLTIAGGTIRPGGTSAGTATLTTGNQKWNSGQMAIKINDTGNATSGGGAGSGTAGSTTGWGEVVMTGLSVSSLSSASPFAITLTSPGGTIADFSNSSNYLWQVGQINSGTTPITPGILATTDNTGANVPTSGQLFTLDTSSFVGSNAIPSGSSFYLEAVAHGGGEELAIGYSGTPEPGTTMLILGGAAPMLMARRRRRAKL